MKINAAWTVTLGKFIYKIRIITVFPPIELFDE